MDSDLEKVKKEKKPGRRIYLSEDEIDGCSDGGIGNSIIDASILIR